MVFKLWFDFVWDVANGVCVYEIEDEAIEVAYELECGLEYDELEGDEGWKEWGDLKGLWRRNGLSRTFRRVSVMEYYIGSEYINNTLIVWYDES